LVKALVGDFFQPMQTNPGTNKAGGNHCQHQRQPILKNKACHAKDQRFRGMLHGHYSRKCRDRLQPFAKTSFYKGRYQRP
tara:strand:+ start:24161 stop:24400 length:240 start_codon:yes stop_codon:yes gene_type:complete